MDREVSQLKFEAEVARVHAYAQEGRPGFTWRIVRTAYPHLILQMECQAGPTFLLRVLARDWPSKPASYLFLDPNDPLHRRILPAAYWPEKGPFLRDHQPVHEKKRAVQHGPRPFICLRGTREFHDDKRHQREPWEIVRREPGQTILDQLIAIQLKINTAYGCLPNDEAHRTQGPARA